MPRPIYRRIRSRYKTDDFFTEIPEVLLLGCGFVFCFILSVISLILLSYLR